MHDRTVREALLQASSLLMRADADRSPDGGGAIRDQAGGQAGREKTGRKQAEPERDRAAEARADAEALIMHVLGWDKTRLLLEGNAPFPAHLAGRWQRMIARRAAGEPVQYITGEQAFYGMDFAVTPAVLIPRPETELLVEQVAKRVRALFGTGDGAGGSAGGQPRLVADIGTGSGAIAVTLARLLPGWRVAACDLSAEALDVARRNARRAAREADGLDGRIRFLQGDLLEPLIALGERVDVLVSNPPYIPSGELPHLERNVRDHEPHLALDGGPDGLDAYRRIMGQIGRLPEPPRLVAFEVGQGQARPVAGLLAEAGHWTGSEMVRDYAGIERHVLAWR